MPNTIEYSYKFSKLSELEILHQRTAVVHYTVHHRVFLLSSNKRLNIVIIFTFLKSINSVMMLGLLAIKIVEWSDFLLTNAFFRLCASSRSKDWR